MSQNSSLEKKVFLDFFLDIKQPPKSKWLYFLWWITMKWEWQCDTLGGRQSEAKSTKRQQITEANRKYEHKDFSCIKHDSSDSSVLIYSFCEPHLLSSAVSLTEYAEKMKTQRGYSQHSVPLHSVPWYLLPHPGVWNKENGVSPQEAGAVAITGMK